jgi:hypothetical protein
VVHTFRVMPILIVVLSVESFNDLTKFCIFCFTLMMPVCQLML